MIGLDTNVLLRYLAQDDAIQSSLATSLIESLTPQTPGFISLLTMAETMWTLRRLKKRTRREIADIVGRMLSAPVFIVEREREVGTAMLTMRRTHAEFSDALIGALNEDAGCSVTMTFDMKAAGLPGFELLQ